MSRRFGSRLKTQFPAPQVLGGPIRNCLARAWSLFARATSIYRTCHIKSNFLFVVSVPQISETIGASINRISNHVNTHPGTKAVCPNYCTWVKIANAPNHCDIASPNTHNSMRWDRLFLPTYNSINTIMMGYNSRQGSSWWHCILDAVAFPDSGCARSYRAE